MKQYFIHTKKKAILSSTLAFCTLLAMNLPASVQAAEEMIDKTSIQLRGDAMTVELWGDRHEGGYTDDLLLLLKKEDKIITAYNPSVKGGYNLMLQTVQVKPVKREEDKTEAGKAETAKTKEQGIAKAIASKNQTVAASQPVYDEQVLLSVGQGDWRARTDYRIVDFVDRENIKELFSGIENLGLVQSAKLVDAVDGEGKTIDVKLIDGEANLAPLADSWKDELGTQALNYGGLTSLTVHDIDDDGQQELFTNQTIEQRRHVLADVAAIWKLQSQENEGTDKNKTEKIKTKDTATKQHKKNDSTNIKKAEEEKNTSEELTIREQRKKARKEVREKLARPTWKQSAFTIMTASLVKDKTNTINDGMDIEDGAGVILSRRIVVPGGEASYPVYAGKDIELQKKINEGLEKARETYLERFYDNSSDMAFKVMRADDVVLSVQYISSTDKGFIHHNVNIDMETGDVLALEDVLDTKDADLLPVLNVLKTNDKLSFANGLPEEWYLEGSNLYFVQNVEDKDEAAGFALGNLHKFLRDAKWLKG